MLSLNEIRKKYLDFFKEKNHAIIDSASLVPENDPSVLFNTAWMQPLAANLLWEIHPMWKKLANCQKCVRTVDIEEVWDNSHLTFFEMLWNWSLWDYFKEESINWSYEFLTSKKWLAIDPEFIAVTVFEGDEDAPRDNESAQIWEKVWIAKEKISYLPKSENWWAAWETWPCWPDTEIFYWVWSWKPPKESNVWNDEDNWMEIWNNVFMEYNKLENWKLVKLPNKNVDTWMWLDRITATIQWVKSVYQTDMFADVISKIKDLSWKWYNERSARIICDHIRSWVVLISDWVTASNVDQWYILRRLLRRSIRESYKMSYEKSILPEIWKMFIWKYENVYAQVKDKKALIIQELKKEEEKFSKTLTTWLKEFEKVLKWFAFEKTWIKQNEISGKKAFTLYDTYWFPIEMTSDLAKEHWLSVDIKWFEQAFEKHQEKSRQASKAKFQWWLADTWEMSTKYHTATHLLHQALKRILWNHIKQRWSNITSERLRFDFSHWEKMTNEQIKNVESLINSEIWKKLDVFMEEMTIKEAGNQWAIWLFWDKYWEKVKVYTIWKNKNNYFSKEICWWPHVNNIWNLGIFKIKKEESSSSWVRRIKAILI